MLIALLILTALSLGLAAAALVLALVVWGGERRVAPPAAAEDEEKKNHPLDDERMREGIANLLSFGVGGGRGEE